MASVNKRARKQLATVMDYKNTFKSPSGSKVLLDLLRNHGMMGSIFSENINEMCLKEGERNVVLRILQIIKTDVSDLLKRIEESEASSLYEED